MAKQKVSEWSSNPAENTDVGGINIAENCPPSNINNSIRQVMSQVKDWQDGDSGDSVTVNGTLTSNGASYINGTVYLDGSLGLNGQVLTSVGSANTPVWASLGTMSAQNYNNVNITGGVMSGGIINGTTKTGVSGAISMASIDTNATGKKTVSSLSPSGGNNGDLWYKV